MSSVLLLSACNNANDSEFAWATVNLSDVQRLMETEAEKQNSELAGKNQSIRGSYDRKHDLKDALYRFTGSAKNP